MILYSRPVTAEGHFEFGTLMRDPSEKIVSEYGHSATSSAYDFRWSGFRSAVTRRSSIHVKKTFYSCYFSLLYNQPVLDFYVFTISFMAKHKLVISPGAYFITFTCHNWLSLIEITNCYDTVYKFFDILKERGHDIIGYSIMPNHIHMIVYYSGGRRTLNLEIGSGKRFLAYEIVTRLKKLGRDDILLLLSKGVKPKDRSRGKKHEVWIDSFDVKHCRTEKFILQKLIYTHNNPCQGKWMLATTPAGYTHSSAAFYEGDHSGYPVRNYLEILALMDKEGQSQEAIRSRCADGSPTSHRRTTLRN